MRIVIMMAMLGIPLAGCVGSVPIQMNAARKTAIHECSVKAEKFMTRNRLTIQRAVYGNCMAAHNQRP